jgi:LemA protein
MSVGKVLGAFFLLLIGGGVLLGGCLYSGYNQAVALDEAVKNSWAEVDNQLQRRFELIPNVVETVKGFAAQEKDIFLGVAEARKSYFQSDTVREKAQAANAFESALSRLLVLQEKYPELKSNESFLKLQDTLEGTENRLTVARQRYNETVRSLNTFSRRLLGRLYAGLAGVEKAEYFETPEAAKTAPKVDFAKPPSGSQP